MNINQLSDFIQNKMWSFHARLWTLISPYVPMHSSAVRNSPNHQRSVETKSRPTIIETISDLVIYLPRFLSPFGLLPSII